jgi:type VI secretion system protein ImpE
MSAEELLKAGDLAGALNELQNRVRSAPGDPEARIFLFQLLATMGNWDRAMTQLETAGDLNKDAWPLVMAYKETINCEKHRAAVFSGQSKPLVFGEPQEWIAKLIEAQQEFALGEYELFQQLSAEAFEEAPATAGTINEEPFEWLAEADQRFGPVMEMIFNGHYYWVPMTNIKSVRTEAPSDLRDLIWLPAEVTWTNGGEVMVMLPVRYPLTEDTSDICLMARSTEWQAVEDDLVQGVGQKMLATDQADYPLLEVRSIDFDA